jgi:hypothetical protein
MILHTIDDPGASRPNPGAVLFLCSEQAAFITGACLAVDGGYSAQ